MEINRKKVLLLTALLLGEISSLLIIWWIGWGKDAYKFKILLIEAKNNLNKNPEILNQVWSLIKNQYPNIKDIEMVLQVKDFEYLQRNAQGYLEFCHKQTGCIFVLIPSGDYLKKVINSAKLYANGVYYIDPFLISKYELTQKVWENTMGYNPSFFKDRLNHPVESVSWEEIQIFLKKTNLEIPTGFQWEVASRARTKTHFYWGDEIGVQKGEYCWYSQNSGGKTHPVGTKKCNGFGIYDTIGNIEEICNEINTTLSGDHQVMLRGCAWKGSSGGGAAFYNWFPMDMIKQNTIGIRLSKSLGLITRPIEGQKKDKE